MTEPRKTVAKKTASKAAAPVKKTASKTAAPAWTSRTTSEITFRDRKIRVLMPEPEQILVWRRIHARMEAANLDDWTGKEVMDALDKVRTIIDTVIVNQADIDWLDDEMLAGRLTIREASTILVDAVKSFQNRSQRRATKTTGPARRKKAA